jgi:glycosyltransferase involved in cell wall biosynthesis
MRILIVSQYFWPEEFRINDLAKSLKEKGHVVEVLTGKPNYPIGKVFPGYRAWGCQQENHHGVHINRIPILARGHTSWRLALNYLSFVLSGLFFSPLILRKKEFDVIFVYAPSPILQTIPALFLGWLKKCPVVLSVQDLWPESLSATGYIKSRLVLKIVEKIVRFIYRHTDLLLVQSKAFEKPVRALEAHTPIIYYPQSVDSAFVNCTSNDVPNLPGIGKGFSLIFAGNIGTAQAVDVIIQAAILLKKYSDIHFVIMGDGSRRKWMLSEVERLDLSNIYLPGRFPIEMMPSFMQKASALLVTLADQPIFALTIPSRLQVYLAVGRPIIACMNGEGARLVIEAKAGFSTPAEDPQALANTILRMYEKSDSEHEQMGESGRKYYSENFEHNQLVEQLIKYLKSVIQDKEKK